MQSPDFPTSISSAAVHEALRVLGIDYQGRRVQSVNVGVNTIRITQTAVDADGQPFIADGGDSIATDTNTIRIDHSEGDL